MPHTLLVAALLLALGTGSAPASRAGGAALAFVAVAETSELVAVEIPTGRVLDRTRVPTGPRSVAAYGLRSLLVTSPGAGKVTLVDSFTRRAVKVFGAFGRPLDVDVGGERGFVTDARRNELVVLDLDRRRIIRRIPVPRRPQSVAAGDVALVTHSPPHVKLTVVHLGVPGPLRPSVRQYAVTAEGGANDVSDQPDTAYAYVTGRDSGGVAGIDWGRGAIPRWWRKVGLFVRNVAFDYVHGRRVWASDAARGDVLALSSETGGVLRRLHGCPGAGPIALAGTWIVASCSGAEAVAVWDTRTWKRTLVPMGGRPHGVAAMVIP